MRDCSKILTVGIKGICLVALIMTAGCGESATRTASKDVRDATVKARRMYNKAHTMLSNPRIYKEGADAEAMAAVDAKVDQEALDVLVKAEKELSAVISANASKQQDIAMDMAEAKLLLGMVQHLQGQCNMWQAHDAGLQARVACEKAYLKLSAAQSANTLVSVYQKLLNTSRGDVEVAAAKAKKDRDAAQSKVAKLKSSLAEMNTQAAELSKAMEDNNLKASTLKKNSALASGQASLQELDKALAVEKQIQDDHFKLQNINHKKTIIKSQLVSEQIKLQDAAGRIKAIAKVKQGRASTDEAYESSLAESKQRVEKLWQEVLASQEEMAGLCGKIVGLADKSEQAYGKARKGIASAQSLGESKAQMLIEQANVVVSSAESNLNVAELRKVVSKLVDFSESVAQGMAVQPAKTLAPGLQKFLDSTKQADASALAAYSKAIDLMKSAVRQASRSGKWQVQRGLAVTYFSYSLALKAAGKDADAQQAHRDAVAAVAKAERGAKSAGKKKTLVELKSLIGVKNK